MDKKTILYLMLGIGVVIIIFSGGWIWIDFSIDCPENRGQFGDKFGAINALFSALAFAVITIALILQSRDLKATLEEMKESKGVSLYQAEIQKISAKISGLSAILQTKMHIYEITVQTIQKTTKQEDKNSLNTKLGAVIDEISETEQQIKINTQELMALTNQDNKVIKT